VSANYPDNCFAHPAIIHCHSTYSDGTKDIPEIAAIAESVGVRILMMTDHNHLRPLKDGHQRWYGSVLTDIGYEINDINDQNHYLAFALANEVDRNTTARHYVQAVADAGGFGFIAHPHEERQTLPDYGIYPWTDWQSSAYSGIEIWNHMSSWMEGLSPSNKYNRVIHPRQSVWGPKEKTLRLWDEIALQRRVCGIGGVDAHGHEHLLYGGIKLRIFPYKILFKCLRTYIVTSAALHADESFDAARQAVHRALLEASVFFAQYYLGDPAGFRFWGEIGGKAIPMGAEYPFSENILLRWRIPQKQATWRLIGNGHVIKKGEQQVAAFRVEKPGVYRLEVRRRKRPWIFSNHIYLRGQQ
jgi:hypothetical protein